MKTSHSLVFFVLILLVGSAIFLWLSYGAGYRRTLSKVVDCHSEIIDDSILNLDADTTLIGAIVSFKQAPLAQSLKDKLDSLDVKLEENSQIFELSPYFIAEIPTASLCELSKLEDVTKIFIPEEKKETNTDNENAAQ